MPTCDYLCLLPGVELAMLRVGRHPGWGGHGAGYRGLQYPADLQIVRPFIKFKIFNPTLEAVV